MKKQHYYLTIISDKEIEPKEILFAISEVRPNWGKMSASCAIPNIKLAAMQARIEKLEALQTIAEDVNTWLIKNKLGGTAHQRLLAEALYALKGDE